ncbi:hypothetical protein [Pseudomonas nitroreducens]|uniref:hypothetical protein n=1 Tax=Pseudomonas nitroreducens TaxID=46680 RepID=UPI00265AF3F6|nr:hypothetical protein [Pseudomonas nitroreducens]MCP1687450.1 hypothetical protein [Pseudomonas nitroreducens]
MSEAGKRRIGSFDGRQFCTDRAHAAGAQRESILVVKDFALFMRKLVLRESWRGNVLQAGGMFSTGDGRPGFHNASLIWTYRQTSTNRQAIAIHRCERLQEGHHHEIQNSTPGLPGRADIAAGGSAGHGRLHLERQ